MNNYKCNLCGKILLRDSEKVWIKSYCESGGDNSRLYKINLKNSKNDE